MTEEDKKQLRDLRYKKDQTSGGLTAGELTTINALLTKMRGAIVLAP